jgi:hypothetical protein
MGSIAEEIAALTVASSNQTAASQELAQEVASKMGQIDQKLNKSKDEYQGMIDGIRSDFPFYRISKNQELKVGGVLTPGTKGTPDGWVNRSPDIHEFEILAYTQTGVEAAQKHPLIKDMWLDIKGNIPQHNQPDFAIGRVSTAAAAAPNSINTFYTLYQGPLPNGVPLTLGAWIKVESGDVRFISYVDEDRIPNDGKWHEVTRQFNMSVGGGSYTFGPHLYVAPGASCLIALPGVIVGKVPPGKWGYMDKPKFEREG